MATISASMVKDLRERTGLGMMECKKALAAAGGDIEKAIEDLRKSSGMKAAKKAGRTAAEGVVLAKVADDNSFGALIEVNSETDFVARDENFLSFAEEALDKVFETKTTDVAALLEAGLENSRQALVQKIGENVNLRRAEIVEGEVVASYIHSNNKIAVLASISSGNSELAKDVAMHVAAANPQFGKKDDVPESVIEKEKEIFSAQAQSSGKPAEIIEKMIVGRINKFLAEISLVEQPFVKDPDVKVGAMLKKAGSDLNSFTRYEVGEGIEVEKVDFAAEVAAAAKQS